MEKIIKIWILSLITGALIYVAFTNRYIILRESNMKYDRWTNQTYEIKVHTESLKKLDKLDILMQLKQNFNKLDELRLIKLNDTGKEDYSKYDSPGVNLPALKRAYSHQYDSMLILDEKIDSLFMEAIYLKTLSDNLLLIQRLSEFINELKNNSKK